MRSAAILLVFLEVKAEGPTPTPTVTTAGPAKWCEVHTGWCGDGADQVRWTCPSGECCVFAAGSHYCTDFIPPSSGQCHKLYSDDACGSWPSPPPQPTTTYEPSGTHTMNYGLIALAVCLVAGACAGACCLFISVLSGVVDGAPTGAGCRGATAIEASGSPSPRQRALQPEPKPNDQDWHLRLQRAGLASAPLLGARATTTSAPPAGESTTPSATKTSAPMPSALPVADLESGTQACAQRVDVAQELEGLWVYGADGSTELSYILRATGVPGDLQYRELAMEATIRIVDGAGEGSLFENGQFVGFIRVRFFAATGQVVTNFMAADGTKWEDDQVASRSPR